MIEGPMPRSENMCSPVRKACTRAIRPNTWGATRRVRIKLETTRMTLVNKKPAPIQAAVLKTARRRRCAEGNSLPPAGDDGSEAALPSGPSPSTGLPDTLTALLGTEDEYNGPLP